MPVKSDITETHGFPIPQDAMIESVAGMGSPQHHVMPLSIGSLFKAILGRDTKTGAGDPYTHTIDWGATAPLALPYYTVWSQLGNGLFEKFVDCRLTHLKLHGDSTKFLEVTATWIGGVPSFLSAEETTATLEKTLRIRYADGIAALKFEGAAMPLARSFDIDIDRGVTLVPGDSSTPNDTIEGAFSAILALTYLPAEFQLFNRLVYGTASPSNAAVPVIAPVELAGSPAGIDYKFLTASAPERSLEILMPRVQLEPFNDAPNVTPGPIVRTVSFKAFGPAAGATPVTAIVLNSQATAY